MLGSPSASQFIQAEGFLRGPESAHRVACAMDKAFRRKEVEEGKAIAFNTSGHGPMDTEAFWEILGL